MERTITVPANLIAELMPYLEEGMQVVADRMGMAGHTPSEQMGDDYDRLETLKSMLQEEDYKWKP
jgi:hypothetical protein